LLDSAGNPRNLTNSKGKKRRPASKSLASITKCSNSTFLDFIHRCLDWDPAKRLKPAKALEHPFIMDVFKNASISALEKVYDSYTLTKSAKEKPSSLLERKTKNIIRKFPSTTSFLRLNVNQSPSSHQSKSKLPAVTSLEKWKSSMMAPKITSSYKQASFGDMNKHSSQSIYSGKNSLPPIAVDRTNSKVTQKQKIHLLEKMEVKQSSKEQGLYNNNNIINEDEAFEQELALLNEEIAKELLPPPPPPPLNQVNHTHRYPFLDENSIDYDEDAADEFNIELRIKEEETQKLKGLSRITKMKEKRKKIDQPLINLKIKQLKKQRVVKPFESDDDSN
jgi:hypothetical protein